MKNKRVEPRRCSQLVGAFELASPVREVEVAGEYDAETQTWSNREFANAGTKKHNEAM